MADRHTPDTTGSPSPELVWSKLVPPAPRAGLITRAVPQSRLQTALEAKLCLLGAPPGSGKTTLLAQWCATAGGGRVAWVSLDEGDNDPTRLWISVGEALRSVEPGVGMAALQALRRTSVDHERAVLPLLLNDLSRVASPLVLVLDDYHLVTNPTCHQTLGFFLDHLPASVHLMLATRVDPPLPLARMRARGELAEVRVEELRFTAEEAFALLNASMGLQLTAEDVERLTQRTEGWAAGLYLAGLSLRGREDPSAFIDDFQGDNRHVADYLTADVLARQPPEMTTFLLRTSVLRRLSGPLCDAVLETKGPPGGWRSWSGRTCSWCHWTTAGSGTATTSCSASCCAWSLTAASPGLRWCCMDGPRPGIEPSATSRRPSVTPRPPASSVRRGR
jgi:LuxR family maltose regulon positive regulatory protein